MWKLVATLIGLDFTLTGDVIKDNSIFNFIMLISGPLAFWIVGAIDIPTEDFGWLAYGLVYILLIITFSFAAHILFFYSTFIVIALVAIVAIVIIRKNA